LRMTATTGVAGVLNGLNTPPVNMGAMSKDAARNFGDITRHLQRAGNAAAFPCIKSDNLAEKLRRAVETLI